MAIAKERRLLYVAIILGFLAILMNIAYIKNKNDELKGGTEEYVVANRDISSGELVTDADLQKVLISANFKPYIRASYLSLSDLKKLKQRAAAWDIYEGEFILKEALGEGTLSMAKKDLSEGQGLYSLPVDEENSIGYRLIRGDLIDIYQLSGDRATLVLPKAYVAEVGVQLQRSGAGTESRYGIVLLRLSPSEWDEILQAEARGGHGFRIIYRGHQETEQGVE